MSQQVRRPASVSGVVAAICATVGAVGFLLTPWLAYLPAVAALGCSRW